MSAALHQFVAGYTNGDAISNESRLIRNVFRKWGYESSIYCDTKSILPELRKDAVDLSYAADSIKKDDTVLLHLSIGSPANEVFNNLNCRKAILYHNVTPSGYFKMINPATAAHLARGRQQLTALAGSAALNMADSRYNAAEMETEGYRDIETFPLFLDLDSLIANPDRKVINELSDGKTNILFVGRCAPNKKLEDVITCFAHYKKFNNPDSRLILVGSYAGTERYYHLLCTKIKELDIVPDVYFAGSVSQSSLNAYYQKADLFLCMSEHEGFCIPVLESMTHRIPTVAFAAAAVPETMDGAGVLVREKNYPLIAELMDRIVSDKKLYASIVEKQDQRLDRYRARNLESELRSHLNDLI